MARRPEVDLFCEDAGHEAFARALLARMAREAGVPTPIEHPRSVRGGHGRAVTELRLWQKARGQGAPGTDLLLVMIDGNGEGPAEQRRLVEAAIDRTAFPNVVVGCPDPHVEAWCASDLSALREVTGAAPPPPPGRPGRHAYKRWLRQALEEAGVLVLNEPMDVAPDLVPVMDLYRAGKETPSLGHLVGELAAFFARWRALR